MTSIYILTDPETGMIRYVGKSMNTGKRFNLHLRDRKKSRKANWIRGLSKRGLEPAIEIIEAVEDQESNQAEIFWIAYFKSIGAVLMNMTNGGDGGRISAEAVERIRETKKAAMTPEVRQRMRLASLGRKQTPETIEKRRQGMIGHVTSKETREKIAAAHIGMKHKPESIEKMRRATMGQKMSEATRLKLISINTGRKMTEENRQKLIERNRARVNSEETREKMRQAKLGTKQSEETRRKRSESLRASCK